MALRTSIRLLGQQGTSTGFPLAPERRGGGAVLVNMDGVDAGNLADEIIKIVFDVKDKNHKAWHFLRPLGRQNMQSFKAAA